MTFYDRVGVDGPVAWRCHFMGPEGSLHAVPIKQATFADFDIGNQAPGFPILDCAAAHRDACQELLYCQ